MPSFSRWQEKQVNDITQILGNIMDYKNFITPIEDPMTKEPLIFSLKKLFDKNKIIKVDDTKIEYNIIDYFYEKPRPGEEENAMRNARIYPVPGIVIIFSDGKNTQFIIDKRGNGALTFLRKINNYRGKGEIENHPIKVTEDFFIWMIDKVLNNIDDSLDENVHLKVNKIIGFKGATEDKLAEVTGLGNRIMNVLSTLAFLFEMEKVNRISPRINFGKHTLEITLDTQGSVNINFDTYIGDFLSLGHKEQSARIILLTYLEIIPRLLTSYSNDIENELWSQEKKIEFFNDIGNDIQNKINEKILSVTK